MGFGGRTGTSGQGRPKGVPNKITSSVKEMILAALNGLGGMDYLMEQGRTNPTAFLSLVGRVLPLQVTGDGGGPVIVVTGVHRENDLKTIEHEPIEQHAEGS